MSEWVQQISVFWWSWIAPLSVQVSVLALLVALGERLLPRRTWPELRAGLWLLVMLKLLLPPWLSSPLAWFPWAVGGFGATPVVDLAGEGAGIAAIFWAQSLVGLWLLGCLSLLCYGLRRRARLLRHWRSGADGRIPEGFAELLLRVSRSLGLRRPPRVLFSAKVRTPFITGIPRPTVFLPETLAEEISPESLEHVLLHELSHIKRLDLWVAELCMILQLIYWFHPFVWLAQRRLAELREQCCDRSVARHLDHATEGYRRTLLNLARRLLDDPLAGQMRFIRPNQLLLARLRLLERPGDARPGLRRATTTLIIALLLAFGLPMARGAEAGSAALADLIERPPGCLQLRYLVLKRIADEDLKAANNQDSLAPTPNPDPEEKKP